MKRFRDNIAVGSETFGDGVFDAPGVDVNYGDDCTTGLARHGCDEKTDSASADNEGGGAGRWGGAVEGVDCDGEGFEEGCCVEGDVIRYPVTLKCQLIFQSLEKRKDQAIEEGEEQRTYDTKSQDG
jgi:hypothetical protein